MKKPKEESRLKEIFFMQVKSILMSLKRWSPNNHKTQDILESKKEALEDVVGYYKTIRDVAAMGRFGISPQTTGIMSGVSTAVGTAVGVGAAATGIFRTCENKNRPKGNRRFFFSMRLNLGAEGLHCLQRLHPLHPAFKQT